jgi:hypothetical protein
LKGLRVTIIYQIGLLSVRVETNVKRVYGLKGEIFRLIIIYQICLLLVRVGTSVRRVYDLKGLRF